MLDNYIELLIMAFAFKTIGYTRFWVNFIVINIHGAAKCKYTKDY